MIGVEQLRFTICDFGDFEKLEIAESSRDHFLEAGSIFHLYESAISSSPDVVVPNQLFPVYSKFTSGYTNELPVFSLTHISKFPRHDRFWKTHPIVNLRILRHEISRCLENSFKTKYFTVGILVEEWYFMNSGT